MSLLSRSFSRNSFGILLNASYRIIPQNFSQSKIHVCSRSRILQNCSPYLCDRDSVRYKSSESYTNSILNSSLIEKITQNDLVFAAQQLLIDVHDFTGFPWWGVIIMTTITVRGLIIFPLAVHQQYVIYKNVEIQKLLNTTIKKEVDKYVSELAEKNKLTAKELNKKYYDELLDRRSDLLTKNNCHPAKNAILVLIQMPIWLMMSSSIRNINSMLPVQDGTAIQAYLEMKATGFGILKDLTIPDGTWTLPILTVIINLIIIDMNIMSRLHKRHWFRSLIVFLMRGVSIFSLPLIAEVPKCMTLFWFTSSLCGLVQNILFISPRTRKILRIPHSEEIRKRPFSHIKNKIKSVFYFLRH